MYNIDDFCSDFFYLHPQFQGRPARLPSVEPVVTSTKLQTPCDSSPKRKREGSSDMNSPRFSKKNRRNQSLPAVQQDSTFIKGSRFSKPISVSSHQASNIPSMAFYEQNLPPKLSPSYQQGPKLELFEHEVHLGNWKAQVPEPQITIGEFNTMGSCKSLDFQHENFTPVGTVDFGQRETNSERFEAKLPLSLHLFKPIQHDMDLAEEEDETRDSFTFE